MNIVDSFAEYLQDLGIATLGQDLFIGEAPSSKQVSNSIWWIIDDGGNNQLDLSTGEKIKIHRISVYNRGNNYQTVKDDIHEAELLINDDGCTQLNGYETLDIEVATFPIDNDIDSEDRKVGLLQVNLKTYKGDA